LTKRLKALEENGVIIRKQVSGQRGYEYRLTPAGKELEPLMENIDVWGMRWARGRMSDDELDVELLMREVQRRIQTKNLPDGETVIYFVFTDLKNTEAGGYGLTEMKLIYVPKIPVRMLIYISLAMCGRWWRPGREILI
jgi:DNA-binding MarR family transcriptional regulator